MSVYGIPVGQPLQERQVVAGAGATTLLTGGSGISVVGILLVNNTGGALTPVVDVYDGSTAFVIRDNASIADQGREVITLPEFIQVRQNDLLRITGGTGLSVFVSYMNISASRAA